MVQYVYGDRGDDDQVYGQSDQELKRAWYKAMTDGRVSDSGERSTRDMLAALERKHGTVKAAAADTGVSESTWRRWKRGESKPKPENLQKVRGARRRAYSAADQGRVRRSLGGHERKPPPGDTETSAPKMSGGLTITGDVTISSDTRSRTLFLGQNLPQGALDQAVEAWHQGDDSAVTDVLNQAVNDYFGGRTNRSGVTISGATISFGPLTFRQ